MKQERDCGWNVAQSVDSHAIARDTDINSFKVNRNANKTRSAVWLC